MRTFCFLSILLWAATFHCVGQTPTRYTLIPRPAQLDPRPGEFVIGPATTLLVPADQPALKALVDSFASQINRTSGLGLAVRTTTQGGRDSSADSSAQQPNVIQFLPTRDSLTGAEGYRIDATVKQITVEASTPAGFFYAVQTLYQLLPPAVLGTGPVSTSAATSVSPSPTPWTIPACRIQDRPRYSYRGLHLDVSRHFFPVSFIKRYIDLMALHKFNNFHWHLTDDQGWRIEIKKYPKLTQIGSQRRETIVGHYDDYDPQVFDGKPYGGFYTQDEVRDVVRYAAERHINVVPEIELPGHALAALAAYPELSCNPSATYQAATKWGVFTDVFCPTEKTFGFLQDVLTEVIDLFPGKYIHIGGDECPKDAWRKSEFCQQLIKREGLKDEHGLQSYFITRIDKFVTAKGRRIIGWDEILEGGLSPNATVMSWRGTKGGTEAARQRHDVIMTPGQFCYFDHYQGDPALEPTGFGGSLPLSKVYAYNPTPAELSPAEATHILGAQGNLWTEYITTSDQVEYMVWPRAAALAEVVWTPLALKSYDDFARRLPTHLERLTNQQVNYARTFFNPTLTGQATPEGTVQVSIARSPLAPGDIRYTLDGSIPSAESPTASAEQRLVLSNSTTVRAATFEGPRPLSQLVRVQTEFLVSKATGKPYTLQVPPTTGRPDKNYLLTNGVVGGMGGYELNNVVSFANDVNAVVDLGQSQPVQSVRVGFVKYTAKNMCLPKQVEISVSDDGQTFKPVLTSKTNAAEGGKRAIVRLPFDFAPTTARYVRIIARNAGTVPAGLRNPGKPAQLAVDEIEIR
ncbi:glycoside hydrolase family 20 protein [Spirosoma utsteinense]|uniref:beta-N-acetylhexosaminidase n=1 Tax=Spirosoma utsteinense TaxID=2585773 RepID=A0ABR6W9E6_9BACT|nr:family 20 glycosylhydrolase [Spirosoma utsteinense]MBC3787609.1 hexosaminidase [Spirosoma utsteinense]MBC3793205.1 hexosaminidase [Spirosoma utsteinense]